MNAIYDRSLEFTTGCKSFKAPNKENTRYTTGTIPKSNRNCTGSQTVQADHPDETRDAGRCTSRDREASGPSELHIRDFLESNQRAGRSNFNLNVRSNLAEVEKGLEPKQRAPEPAQGGARG